MGNGQIIPTSNFAIAPESVVQVKQNQNLTIFTSTNEPERIQNVKVINSYGQTTELLPPQFSLSNLQTGVYTLDVIIDNPTTNSLDAYETLLIILAPDQQPIQKTEINNIIQKTKLYLEIEFKEEFECQRGYYYDRKTDNCLKRPTPLSPGECEDPNDPPIVCEDQLKPCPGGIPVHRDDPCPIAEDGEEEVPSDEEGEETEDGGEDNNDNDGDVVLPEPVFDNGGDSDNDEGESGEGDSGDDSQFLD
jgi:hypothetical protein